VLKKKQMSNETKKEFLAEMELLSKLDHPNIIKVYELYYYNYFYYVVLDERGRHRLYSNKLKKHILISDNEFNSLYGTMRGSASDNLLLLQSSVGTIKKTPSFKHSEEPI
jgi:serine/threonine protein kinase